jgi:hypothetical protein
VIHTCSPTYSGNRDQEDGNSKPAWANSSRTPILKIPNTKKGWQSGVSAQQVEALNPNPSTTKKKSLGNAKQNYNEISPTRMAIIIQYKITNVYKNVEILESCTLLVVL